MTKLKICGLMNETDIRICASFGADILGFVVNYPVPVPWNITEERARELIACAPNVAGSCIVTGGRKEDILSLAASLKPDYIQLHYRETLEETRYLAEALLHFGIKTIKSVPVKEDGSCEMPEFASVAEAVAALSNTGVAAILIDSRCAASPALSSREPDIDFCRYIVSISEKPVILAGGITGDNIGRILKEAAPYGVDILTGTEDAPGLKSRVKCQRIGTAHNSAAAQKNNKQGH